MTICYKNDILKFLLGIDSRAKIINIWDPISEKEEKVRLQIW